MVTDAILTFLVATVLKFLFCIDFNIFYFWLCWVFIAAGGLSPAAANRSVVVCGLLTAVGPLVAEWAQELWHPGLAALWQVGSSRHMSCPLPWQADTLGTGPPGKSLNLHFILEYN